MHTLELSFINKVAPKMGQHFSYLIWVTRRHMNPLFTSVICDNLLTKHLTHMAYISRPLVRNFIFCKLGLLIYLNLTS